MKLSYVNFKKEFPALRSDPKAFSRWFFFTKFWGGKLICFGVKHHQITIDLRQSVIADLMRHQA